jgi:quercetin dioxygenase-like cupin family protein
MSQLIAQEHPVTALPGKPEPYVLEAGSGRAHVLLGEVGRALIGAEETGDRMSVMTLTGPRAERPIPLHYHDHEQEFFYCWRGQIQLWADDESRVLSSGDFGFIPPGTVHAYQLRGNHSSFMGPIFPAGWDRFFDLTGEPYGGGAFPQGPPGPPPFEKFGRAEQEFKMKYRPDLPYAEARSDVPDETLSGGMRPYFLRAGEGPKHVLGGQLQTALVTAAETDGQISMFTVEAPKGPPFPTHAHERTHEAIFVIEGRLRVWLDGEEYLLTRGDCASIPAGCEHTYASESHYTKWVDMSSPGRIEEIYAGAGEATDAHVFPDTEPAGFDLDRLRELSGEIDVVWTGGGV